MGAERHRRVQPRVLSHGSAAAVPVRQCARRPRRSLHRARTAGAHPLRPDLSSPQKRSGNGWPTSVSARRSPSPAVPGGRLNESFNARLRGELLGLSGRLGPTSRRDHQVRAVQYAGPSGAQVGVLRAEQKQDHLRASRASVLRASECSLASRSRWPRVGLGFTSRIT